MSIVAIEKDQFLELIQTNKELAYSYLVTNYAQKVWMICNSVLHSKEDAEDVTQEVFTAVYLGIEKFKGNSTISTWIHSIALNKSKEHIRTQSRQKRKGFLTLITGKESGEEFVALSETDTLESKQEIAIVRNAISQLPENQRIVYSLVKLDEFSYKEVEEMTGFTKSAIESLMFRAKSKLVELLEDYYKKHYK